MAKHSEKKGKRKIIQLKDHMPQQQAEPSCPERETDPQEEELPQAAIEYGEGEDGEEKGKKPFQTPVSYTHLDVYKRQMKSRGKLAGNAVVGTIMTNLGFQRFCEENGMKFEATKVGDRYALEGMLLSLIHI